MQIDSRDRSAEVVFGQLTQLLLAGGTIKVGPHPEERGQLIVVVVPSDVGKLDEQTMHAVIEKPSDVVTLRLAMSWAIQEIGFGLEAV